MGSTGPIKLGIIGYGFSAKVFHLPFIVPNPNLKVHAFLQRDPSLFLQRAPSRPSRVEEEEASGLSPTSPTRTRRASLATDVFPAAKRYRTEEDFFADGEIEVVVVCSRDDTHAYFATLALENGKHCVVEKPFARSTAEADKVIALAKERKLLLTCFQNRRWDGDFLTLQKLTRGNALGRVVDAQMHYDMESPGWINSWTDTAPYEKGSGKGIMYGLGSHSFDQTIVLFGRPKNVTGFLRSLRGVQSEVEDTFTVVLQYEGEWRDLLVTVKTSVVTVLRDPLKYIIRGRGGSFIKVSTRSILIHQIQPSFSFSQAIPLKARYKLTQRPVRNMRSRTPINSQPPLHPPQLRLRRPPSLRRPHHARALRRNTRPRAQIGEVHWALPHGARPMERVLREPS